MIEDFSKETLERAEKLVSSLEDSVSGVVPLTSLIRGIQIETGFTFEDSRAVVYELMDNGAVELTSDYRVRLLEKAPAHPPVVASTPLATAREAASWDETFMRMALVVANRSKDPSTQVGACIVSAENRILSLGYNGTPNGWKDSEFPWGKTGEDQLETKYPYVIHAERNAVLNYGGLHSQLRGAKAFVTHFPCNECAKELAQVGVAEVIYLNSHSSSDWSTQASLRIFEACDISVRQLTLSELA